MTQEEWNRLAVGDYVTNKCHLYKIDGFCKDTIYDTIHEKHEKDDHVISVTCEDMTQQTPGKIRDKCAFEGWYLADATNWPVKEYSFDVEISFPGTVKVIAQSKLQAMKFVEEHLKGAMKIFGLEGANFVDWSISNKSKVRIKKDW